MTGCRWLLLLAAVTSALQQAPAAAPQQAAATKWDVKFEPENVTLHMKTQAVVGLTITNIDTSLTDSSFYVRSSDPELAFVDHVIPTREVSTSTGRWQGNFTLAAIFLGRTEVYVELVNNATGTAERNDAVLKVTVIRPSRIIDHLFVGSVVLLMSVLYINFGAALDLTVLRGIVTRPVGPTIGFVSQFIIMPLLSYGLGVLLFPDSVEMQLGLFFTGVSPSGGASNTWAVILNGNINLSVLMTTISNFAAFFMMPLWIFTLGALIFERGDMEVPYIQIAEYVVALVIPLAIGIAIQKWSPRVTRFLVRWLKPISACLIIFIVIFAIVTNLYIFKLFSWQIVLAGLALPWLGYAFGYLMAKLARRDNVDALTIAIETGIQNTGISIFLLRLSLDQPQADLTTVIPVAVAIMTPLPLLCLYLFQRFTRRTVKDGLVPEQDPVDGHES